MDENEVLLRQYYSLVLSLNKVEEQLKESRF